MINKILQKLIRKLVTLYYKRTHFLAYCWGIDETNDIQILSREQFESYERVGIREIPYKTESEVILNE